MTDSDLPESVVKLDCPNGSEVYLVGTSHFSPESVHDVRRIISLKQPKVVLLELCSDRKAVYQYSEEELLRESQNMTFAKMRHMIRRDGLLAGIAQSICLKYSAELTQQLGVFPGGEFRAGYEEAVKVKANIVLGDRLIGITFKRAIATFSFWNKLYFSTLLFQSLTSMTKPITPEEIEQMKSQDMLQLLLGDLTTEYPDLMEVIVNERDKILTYSLMASANCVQEPHGAPVTVVGVVGVGHINGIRSNWMAVQDVRHLLTIPEPSRSGALIRSGFKYTIRLGIASLCLASLFVIGRKVHQLVC